MTSFISPKIEGYYRIISSAAYAAAGYIFIFGTQIISTKGLIIVL